MGPGLKAECRAGRRAGGHHGPRALPTPGMGVLSKPGSFPNPNNSDFYRTLSI